MEFAGNARLSGLMTPTEHTLVGFLMSGAFTSILFENPDDRERAQRASVPACFADLNLDQIVDSITAEWGEYDLKPFFYLPLSSAEAVSYRHEIMRDFDAPGLPDRINAFSQSMRAIRACQSQARKLHYKLQQEAWHLEALGRYCRAVRELAHGLQTLPLHSRGFFRLRDYLAAYAASARFRALDSETGKLQAELAAIRYCVLVSGSSFTVRDFRGESDYSAEVEETFAKFKQGEVRDYRVKFPTANEMNHIEAKILEFVVRLHPDVFAAVRDFSARTERFIDETVAVFDREVQFYVAYRTYTGALARAGLPFSYPQMAGAVNEIYARDGFDLALAHKLHGEGAPIVCNDFELRGRERILVVSGPNQGGKTTFARMFGQLHYLAALGCPVPARSAELLLFDRLFTHFEKEEKVENLRGKLEDDLVRMQDILRPATARSIIILNEIFTSTTIEDETFLSRKVMERIIELNALCVWVTFVDELASSGPQTVSMASTVVPDNPALRTFKVLRRPADGLAYAMAIAEKYRLTYDAIKLRIRS
jgi:DNA mismatch repair protein MutS